ncbi:hypothetical protein [Lihuaxuella thermophila]|uniref:Uncharacterized protein n=1 Tax=Lihuaxuella thermophila TaxID=1173111 RepID=A0A1H8G4Y2_9BACL|nr:hypothetical protein [Lihuaxuella thermophila]SEN39073.1 hypothetical protein SAMN05444955_11078 [Lihuaxuella thermophila]
MKKYVSPSLAEFGKASELIQGCGGLGVETIAFYDSDRRWRWIYTSDSGWICVCTTVSGERC